MFKFTVQQHSKDFQLYILLNVMFYYITSHIRKHTISGAVITKNVESSFVSSAGSSRFGKNFESEVSTMKYSGRSTKSLTVCATPSAAWPAKPSRVSQVYLGYCHVLLRKSIIPCSEKLPNHRSEGRSLSDLSQWFSLSYLYNATEILCYLFNIKLDLG